MKEELVRKIFSKLYPHLIIMSIEFLDRQQLNENNEWVEDSPAVFVGIHYHESANYDSIREDGNISASLTRLTGFEFNVFIS